MNPFLAVCFSALLPYSITLGDHTEHGTVAYRTPAHCAEGVLPPTEAAPEAPPVLRYEYPAPARQRALAATAEAPKAKNRAKGCKPGRWKDSRGICRRKR